MKVREEQLNLLAAFARLFMLLCAAYGEVAIAKKVSVLSPVDRCGVACTIRAVYGP